MHWDGAVSIGNVLTFVGMMAALLWGFNQFTNRHSAAITQITDALNNMAHITDGLQKAVEKQNGRLARVETELLIRGEVEKRLASLGHSTAEVQRG